MKWKGTVNISTTIKVKSIIAFNYFTTFASRFSTTLPQVASLSMELSELIHFCEKYFLSGYLVLQP